MTQSTPEIWVFGALDDDAIRGGTHWETLDPETLRQNLSDFSQAIVPALNPLKSISEDYALEEIELSLTVSASGKVGFLGSGAEVSGGATIKVKLKAV